jgi:hypothetical protein
MLSLRLIIKSRGRVRPTLLAWQLRDNQANEFIRFWEPATSSPSWEWLGWATTKSRTYAWCAHKQELCDIMCSYHISKFMKLATLLHYVTNTISRILVSQQLWQSWLQSRHSWGKMRNSSPEGAIWSDSGTNNRTHALTPLLSCNGKKQAVLQPTYWIVISKTRWWYVYTIRSLITSICVPIFDDGSSIVPAQKTFLLHVGI